MHICSSGIERDKHIFFCFRNSMNKKSDAILNKMTQITYSVMKQSMISGVLFSSLCNYNRITQRNKVAPKDKYMYDMAVMTVINECVQSMCIVYIIVWWTLTVWHTYRNSSCYRIYIPLHVSPYMFKCAISTTNSTCL